MYIYGSLCGLLDNLAGIWKHVHLETKNDSAYIYLFAYLLSYLHSGANIRRRWLFSVSVG